MEKFRRGKSELIRRGLLIQANKLVAWAYGNPTRLIARPTSGGGSIARAAWRCSPRSCAPRPHVCRARLYKSKAASVVRHRRLCLSPHAPLRSSVGHRWVFEPGAHAGAAFPHADWHEREDDPVRLGKHTTSPAHFLWLTAGPRTGRMYAGRGTKVQPSRANVAAAVWN